MFGISFGFTATDRLRAFDPLPIAGAEIGRGIRENTARSVDANGRAFDPYTPAYARRRQRMGLTTRVTLRVRAEDSLLDTLGEHSPGEISVSPSREGQSLGLQKEREFMGVTAGAVARTEERLVQEFERMFS